MVEIRRLKETDRDAWRRQRLLLWPGHVEAEFDTDITQMLANPDTPTFGGFEGGELVGFAEASIRPYGDGCETSPVAWLEGIYVAPSHRRQGLGRGLVDAIASWARERGFSEMGSDAAIYNTTSHLSHAGWGFEETERIVLFRRKLT
ncbi:GNAT family N-acetyltransferase [Devosia sp. D6-9]|nr:GNAT family N-acetyltransferase [Devosia sp. D6-9]